MEPCPFHIGHPDVLMMQSTALWNRDGPAMALDGPANRRILSQRQI